VGQVCSQKESDDANVINTLAAAHFRNGEWRRLLVSTVDGYAGGGDSCDWLFMAMSYWHTEITIAREWLKIDPVTRRISPKQSSCDSRPSATADTS
jgi:hypothetical protein